MGIISILLFALYPIDRWHSGHFGITAHDKAKKITSKIVDKKRQSYIYKRI